VFLEPRFWTSATLIRKKIISHDTRIFTFQLDHDSQLLGLPVGQHVMLKIKDSSSATGESIIRPYTPISEKSARGTVDLLIKVYYPIPPRPGGKLTVALDRFSVGTEVEFKGPFGGFEYLGKGRVTVGNKERQVQSFYMICGGSGMTPIFQILRAVMTDEGDNTSCVVLDGNRSEEDILCRSELDIFAAQNTHKCKITYILEKPPEAWAGPIGFITKDMLKEHVVSGDGSMVLICGPGPMEAIVRRNLLDLGWDKSDLHSF
jgi:nitrate reductase (NAD(P)H)